MYKQLQRLCNAMAVFMQFAKCLLKNGAMLNLIVNASVIHIWSFQIYLKIAF